MSEAEEKGGGTPPPLFLKTIPEPPVRRGPGAPLGNRNAVKTGQHTAEMRALRAEVRFAVLKAKALAAAAWASPLNFQAVIPGERERNSGRAREGDPGA
ncbi:MAG: hypothetical protein ACJ8IR_10345 [Alphaproteobacteria bacterium]|jgi:hypothetical protein